MLVPYVRQLSLRSSVHADDAEGELLGPGMRMERGLCIETFNIKLHGNMKPDHNQCDCQDIWMRKTT